MEKSALMADNTHGPIGKHSFSRNYFCVDWIVSMFVVIILKILPSYNLPQNI